MASATVDAATLSRSVQRQARSLESGEYSDLTIICDGKTFHLHKEIVCSQSKPLHAMATGKFMEGITGVITLLDDELEVFERLVSFLYTEAYNDAPKTNANPGEAEASALLLNTKVYVMAEKYDIYDLKILAANKFQAALPNEWNSRSMTTSIKIMYEEIPVQDILKKIAMNWAVDHIQDLLGREEFVDLCKERSDVCFDLLWKQNPLIKQCPACENDKLVRTVTKYERELYNDPSDRYSLAKTAIIFSTNHSVLSISGTSSYPQFRFEE